MGLLEQLSSRGDIASQKFAQNLDLPFGGARHSPWNSGYQGLHGLTDQERLKLFKMQLEMLQSNASRNVPGFVRQRAQQ